MKAVKTLAIIAGLIAVAACMIESLWVMCISSSTFITAFYIYLYYVLSEKKYDKKRKAPSNDERLYNNTINIDK